MMSDPSRDSLAGYAPGDDTAARGRNLVLVANAAMRARRAPMAILWMWGFQTIFALLATWPLTSFGRVTYGRHPFGDAPLWRPGGLALMDFGLAGDFSFRTTTPMVTFVLVGAALLGLVPLALLIGQMAFASRQKTAATLSQLLPRALLAFVPMAMLLLLTTFVELVLVGIGLALARGAAGALEGRLGLAQAEQVGGVVALLFFIVASVAGVLQDLARTAILRFQVNARGGLVLAASTFRRAPILLYWSWLWRTAAGVVLLVLGSAMAERLGGRGGAAVLFLLVVHQAIILGRIALRASWLAQALRSMDRAHRIVRRPSGEMTGSSMRISMG